MTQWIASLAIAMALLSPANAAFSAQNPDAEKKPDSTEEKRPDKEKTFEETIKGAKVTKGLFTLYQTDEKVFLEVQPNQLDRMYILSLTCESGLGEGGFYGAEMCGQTLVTFHKEGKTVQLVAKNTRFVAKEDLPIRRAVDRSFSDSILGSGRLASLPQPERHSLLVDFGDFLLADLPMYGYALELSFRFPYRFDPKNSHFGTLRSFEKNVEIETVAHYAIERPPLPPLVPPGTPLPPMPPPPRDLPDVRSLLVHFRYSFSELPPAGFPAEIGRRPRRAFLHPGRGLQQR